MILMMYYRHTGAVLNKLNKQTFHIFVIKKDFFLQSLPNSALLSIFRSDVKSR